MNNQNDGGVLTIARLNSTNFVSDVVTAVMVAVGAGAMIVTSFNYDETITAILEQNWEYVAATSIPALITFVTKVIASIKAKTFSFKAIFKSKNAVTKLLVVLSGLLAMINIGLPADAPQVLSDAIFSGSVATIISAVLAVIINPIWHILFDKDDGNGKEQV